MNEVTSGGATLCWNCGQPLAAGAATCLYCGLAQNPLAQNAQLGRFTPRGGGGVQPVIAGVPEVLLRPRADAAAVALAPTPLSGTEAAPAGVTPAATTVGLGPAFAGAPAAVGTRIIAFTIDVALVAVIAVAVGLVTRSMLLGVVTAVEALGILWILQARAGLSVGGWFLGLRVSRVDAPFSPGAVPSLARGLVVLAGGLAAAVGAWIVEASGAWDASGRRRSWADRIAGTVVVAVPRRTEEAAQDRGQVEFATPTLVAAPESAPPAVQAGSAAPSSIAAGERPAAPEPVPPVVEPAGPALVEETAPPVVAAAPALVEQTAPPVAVTPPSPVLEPVPDLPAAAPLDIPGPLRRRTGRVSDQATAEPGPRRRRSTPPDVPAEVQVGGELLVLTFDTGQRESVPQGSAANLGRNPEASEPTDLLIRVRGGDSTVSRTHARLEHLPTGVWVTDNGSTNGTDLLDESGQATPLAPGTRTLVDDGSRVRVGDRVFSISRMIGASS